MDSFNGVLAQVTDIYSAADESNYRRQKVYKNGFAKVVLILECDAIKEAEEALINGTAPKGTKKKQQC